MSLTSVLTMRSAPRANCSIVSLDSEEMAAAAAASQKPQAIKTAFPFTWVFTISRCDGQGARHVARCERAFFELAAGAEAVHGQIGVGVVIEILETDPVADLVRRDVL